MRPHKNEFAPQLIDLPRRCILNPPFHFVKKLEGSQEPDYNTFFAMETASQVHQVTEVKAWLVGAQRSRSLLAKKVSKLEKKLRLAKLDVQLADQIITENASIVATRKKIPAEVLGAIFTWVTGTNSRMKRTLRALTLSHVCKAWRNVALGHTALWTLIDILPQGTGGWGGTWSNFGPKDLRNSRRLELVKTITQRSGGPQRWRPLDIVLSAEDDTPAELLEFVIGLSDRWGCLQLRSPQLICAPRDPERSAEEHPLVSHLTPILGCLSALRVLKVEGHERRGQAGVLSTTDSLWHGDEPEERDILPWFQQARQLRHVVLDSVWRPEETLLVQWAQIEKYTEVNCDRNGGVMPIHHLQEMSNLVELSLDGTMLHDAAQGGLVTLPNLTTLDITLTNTS